MERIRALINKLKDQSEQHAKISAMMVTVQLIQSELTQLLSSEPQKMGTSKVAVVMPSFNKTSFTYKEPIAEQGIKPVEPTPQIIAKPVAKPAAEPIQKNAKDPIADLNKEIMQSDKAKSEIEQMNKLPVANEGGTEAKKQDQSGWLFDPVQEIPTLAHQKEFKERNDVFGEFGSSLNDKLKTERKELAAVLNEGPVRDLKKAIGINDRFVFLSELFRGDEAMYERSIKTINNFRIYPEAEYWIERELKVKLGWDENKEAVKHFRQLVKRRFL